MSAEDPDIAVTMAPPRIFHVAVVNPIFEFANKLHVIDALVAKMRRIIVKSEASMILHRIQGAVRRADIKSDLGRVDFQREVHIHGVKCVQNRDKPFSKVVISLLQKRLTRWRESVAGMPDARSAKSIYDSGKVDVFARLGIDEVSAGFGALFQALRGPLTNTFRIAVTPDLRRKNRFVSFID